MGRAPQVGRIETFFQDLRVSRPPIPAIRAAASPLRTDQPTCSGCVSPLRKEAINPAPQAQPSTVRFASGMDRNPKGKRRRRQPQRGPQWQWDEIPFS